MRELVNSAALYIEVHIGNYRLHNPYIRVEITGGMFSVPTPTNIFPILLGGQP